MRILLIVLFLVHSPIARIMVVGISTIVHSLIGRLVRIVITTISHGLVNWGEIGILLLLCHPFRFFLSNLDLSFFE